MLAKNYVNGENNRDFLAWITDVPLKPEKKNRKEKKKNSDEPLKP